MQPHNNHSLFAVVVSLVALGLTAHVWAAPASPEQASTLPPLPQVAQGVASPSAQVRREALRGLRERGGPETLPLLARLVGDAEIDIREGALAGVIGVYVPPRGKRSITSAAAAFEVARFHGEPWSVPPELSTALVKALADDEPSVRRDAAYAVGIVLTPPVADNVAFEILASLSDREPSVRIAAARALGRLRVKDAGVPLTGRVSDEDLDVRLASMRALGDLRYERAVLALTEQFAFYVRGVAGRSAISALAAIGHPSTIPLFEAQSTSGYPAHRQAAYEGLARSGGATSAAPRIETAMASEKDERVLAAMAFALASAGRDGINRLLDTLADRDRSEDALAYVVELGQPHVAAVAARLNDPNPFVRGQIATALGFIGGPEALAALKRVSGESDPDVRQTIDFAQLRIARMSGR
ncbi:MAG: HEAT repeat domain-containing protein [Vicinamibacterales bacterium]|nr:HEAT repeat domain-containing protein [Vicinamibacterales bacterium]